MSQRNEQLERIRRRYVGRGKEGKSRLLDEFCEQPGYERKYAIKLLQVQPELPAPRKRNVDWSDPTLGIESATNVVGPYQAIAGATPAYTNGLGTNAMMFFRFAR